MNNINLPWIIDEKYNEPSVSLTNFVVAAVFLLVAGTLNLAGVISHTGIALEYFGISAALYFGRNVSISGKVYKADKEKEEESNEGKN